MVIAPDAAAHCVVQEVM